MDENNYEMFSGAASEIIPSSISSFHYPHHFGSHRSEDGVLRETSPLLESSHPEYGAGTHDLDLRSVKLNATQASTDTVGNNFRFFSPNEIEQAPGGSTLENPADPVDYDTNWDYSVEKFEENEEAIGVSLHDSQLYGRHRGSESSSKFLKLNGLKSFKEFERMPRSPHQRDADHDEQESDNESSYSTMLDDRYRRRSTDSGDKNSSSIGLRSVVSDSEENAFLEDFNSSARYQRYYLAEEDIVIGIAGYSNCWWKVAVYYLICTLTLGLGYLVLRWLPRYRINLKGTQSPLGKADWVVIENEYGELTIKNISRMRFGGRLSYFMPLGSKTAENGEELVVSESVKESNPTIPFIHSFDYRYIKFFYNPVEDIFRTNSTWCDLHWLNVKNLRDGTSQTLQEQRSTIFGHNNLNIEEKTIVQLLADEVLHPFYVFQIFSILLWLADDYYYYASCIFIISLVSIVNSLVETKSTIRRLQEMSRFSCDIRAWRNEFWTQIDSNDLVPGDVFEVDPSLTLLPCDALLINGECVVNESMLTGESVPVSKTSATSETVKYLTENFTHPVLAKSFLYNGTKLLKMKSSNDEPVLAMVLKTGFNTTKGSLVRSMLFPKPTGFKFYQDSFKYIGFMTLIAFIGFIYSTYNFIQLGISKRIMILRALDIITIVVPPALPATLTIGTSFAVNRLKSKQIFCIAPTRVNIGGKLDIICFDKTGTLTEDGLDILGVHPTKNAEGRKEIIFEELVENVETLSSNKQSYAHKIQSDEFLLGCMASCHSLRFVDDKLVGDPLEVKMFDYTKWNFTEEFGGSNVPLVYENIGKETFGYKILKEYEFISALRRMSVLVEKDGFKHVFVKGAPEVMLDICDPTTIPGNFEQLLHKYTHGGYRVIACAHKELSKKVDMKLLDREEAENDLSFAGFIVFENKLKASTKETLKELRSAAIRTVMCTGDNVLTAVSVGKECELIDPSVTQIYIPRFASDEEISASGGTGLIWENIHDHSNKLDPVSLQRISRDIRNDVHEYILAITGDVFRYVLAELQNESITRAILMRCDIFARMSPDEKHELVQQLQKLDYTVGFCGDGANDCGALKAADVGISLSEAEASVAAPFTSRIFEISCVLDVIKEGRSSLVTSFSCFKYMSLYSAIQFITVSIMYKRGSNLGDFQFLYIDLFLILPLAIFMSWSNPFECLVVKRPTANLVSPKVLIPLLSHIVVILFFQVAIWLYVQGQPWYLRPTPSDDDDDVRSSDNTVLFLFTNFQYILSAVVLSTGPPYREPLIKNKPFLANLVFAILLSISLFSIDGESWMGNFMQLTNMSTSAYWMVLVAGLANFAVLKMGEDYWFKTLAQLYKRVVHRGRMGTSKKKFKNLKKEFVLAV